MHGFCNICKTVTAVHICKTRLTNGLHVTVYSMFICSCKDCCNLLVCILCPVTLTVIHVCKNYLLQNWRKYLNGC